MEVKAIVYALVAACVAINASAKRKASVAYARIRTTVDRVQNSLDNYYVRIQNTPYTRETGAETAEQIVVISILVLAAFTIIGGIIVPSLKNGAMKIQWPWG